MLYIAQFDTATLATAALQYKVHSAIEGKDTNVHESSSHLVSYDLKVVGVT